MKAKVKVMISYTATEMGTLMHALRAGATVNSRKLADSIDAHVYAAASSVCRVHNRNVKPQAPIEVASGSAYLDDIEDPE